MTDVLLVADRWNAGGGGRERYLADLHRALGGRGWRVHLLLAANIGEHSLTPAIAQFRTRHPGAPVMAVRPALGATHYQLHSGTYAASFATEREAFDSILRRVCAGTALRLNRRRQHLLRTEAAMLAPRTGTRVMAFSRHSADDLCRRFDVNPKHVTVHHPGVDLSVFNPPTTERPAADVVRLLFVGHNFQLKGLRWALEAVAGARRQGVDAWLSVVGADSPSPYRRLAHRLGIRPQVDFLGSLRHEHLASLYRASVALLHPTFYDPFPRVVPEALACGLPVITTACCGAAEVVTSGVNGFVVSSPRDVKGLVDAVTTLSQASTRADLSLAAAERGRLLDFETHVGVVESWLAA